MDNKELVIDKTILVVMEAGIPILFQDFYRLHFFGVPNITAESFSLEGRNIEACEEGVERIKRKMESGHYDELVLIIAMEGWKHFLTAGLYPLVIDQNGNLNRLHIYKPDSKGFGFYLDPREFNFKGERNRRR